MATVDKSVGEAAFDRLSSDAVRTFTDDLGGDVLTPSDEAYEERRQVWNGMIDRYPAIVARCVGVDDVVAAVEFAREQALTVGVRGGGHNVAGAAIPDGGLVVDLSEMADVRVDRDARTVRAAGGATLGDVDRVTQRFGLATALGAVSETGIAGLTLNGGYGHLSRQYGLALDDLIGVEIVTADGQIRTANTDQNADLFWAVRGGGGSFGIVTAFEYALHDVGPEVYTLFTWYHGDDTAAVMDAFQEWSIDAPREAGVLVFTAHVPEGDEFPVASWGEPALVFLGSYRGSVDEANGVDETNSVDEGERVFRPLRERTTPIVDMSGPMGYVDLQSMLDEDYPDGLRYYWKSIYLTELTDEVVELMQRYTESAPSALSTVDLWYLEGAVGEVSRDATAFWHRDKPYMLNFEANWEDSSEDDSNVTWAREGVAEARALSVAGGGYGNFPGLNEDPATQLYGDNLERLVDVKTAVDPENMFRSNGTIEPRAAE